MNALEFAINQEQDGEKYYREQAEKNQNNVLNTVCLMLAEDEKNHALILRKKLKGVPYELNDSSVLIKEKNIFKGIGDIKLEDKKVLSQLDFYTIVLEKEKQSIDLYTGFLSKAKEDQEKILYKYLIGQEKLHYDFFEQLVLLLRSEEQWVESAEFGLRKEY
jgi:rubrerythrin